METEIKQSNRGGHRPGSGRPRGTVALHRPPRRLGDLEAAYWYRWAPAALASGRLTHATRHRFERLCSDAAAVQRFGSHVRDGLQEFEISEDTRSMCAALDAAGFGAALES